MKNLIIFILSTFSFVSSLQAKIYLDHEKEPWPLVTLEIVFPYGAISKDAVKQVNGIYAEAVLQTGSKEYSKEAYTNKLSDFGASVSYEVGSRYSILNLEFLFVEGRDYAELAQLVRNTFLKPRVTKEEFQLAEKRLKTQIISALDSDPSLLNVTLQRWVKAKKLGFVPLTLDTLKKVSLQSVSQFISELYAVENLWVGYLGSEKNTALVEAFLKELFPEQKLIQKGNHFEVLASRYDRATNLASGKDFLIVDKKGLNQSVIGMYSLHGDKSLMDQELLSRFSHYILSGRSLDSILASEIRKKRGLAYFAQGLGRDYYEFPLLGLLSNPQRKKQKEALEVFAMLTKDLYGNGKLVDDIPDAEWPAILKSFRYSNILNNSTPSKRLALRALLVQDYMSKDFYKSNPSRWKLSKNDVKSFLSRQWAGGSQVLGVLGDARELKPLVKSNFPDYKVHVIPYKDIVFQKTFQ